MEILNYLSEEHFTKKDALLIKFLIMNESISERKFRKLVEKNNNDYAEGKSDYYIAHSLKGYKKTKDKQEIISSTKDLKKRAMNELVKVSKTMKRLGIENNLYYDFEESKTK